MKTYWLVGENTAKRLARIKENVFNAPAGCTSFDRKLT